MWTFLYSSFLSSVHIFTIFAFNQNLCRKMELWYRYTSSCVHTLRLLSSAQQPWQRCYFTPAKDLVQFNRTIFLWFGRQGRGGVILFFIPWWMFGSRLYFPGMCRIFCIETCDVIISRQNNVCMQAHTHIHTCAHKHTSAHWAACLLSTWCCKSWWLAEFPPAACLITARSAYTDTPSVWAEQYLLCSDLAFTRSLCCDSWQKEGETKH